MGQGRGLTYDTISAAITSHLPVNEYGVRGAKSKATGVFSLRFKPSGDMKLSELLSESLSLLSSGVIPGVSNLQLNDEGHGRTAYNSGRFSSVSFDLDDDTYEVILGEGANGGQAFEKKLVKALEGLIADPDKDNPLAAGAINALEKIDPSVKLENIQSIEARTGKTTRHNLTPGEIGPVVADIIIHLSDGGRRYISVKNIKGSTVSSISVVDAFTVDLTPDTESEKWKQWLEPLGLDKKRIADGYELIRKHSVSKRDPVDTTVRSIDPDSEPFNLLERLWGWGYYYLRQTGPSSFKAIDVTEEYVRDVLLKGIRITKISYPFSGRKGITVDLESDHARYQIQVRNERSNDTFNPTRLQFKLKGLK